MTERFQVGDDVRLWKPRHAEHGAYGKVESIEPYDGPSYMGEKMYRVEWTWADGNGGFVGTLPDAMVCSERDF